MSGATDFGAIVSTVTAEHRASAHAPASLAAGKPVLKSAGGKTRLLPILLAHLPRSFDRYFEPFVGGGALYFAIASAKGSAQDNSFAVLGDLNPDVIETYAALVFDVERVIRSWSALIADHERDPKRAYYFARDLFNDDALEADFCERAALVLYLNHACFNGLWRVNRAGKFNVPIGDAKPSLAPERLRAAARALSKASLLAADYRVTVANALAGDFVYFDSPYDETFTAYTRGGFTLDDQTELAGVARRLADRGVHVLLSNSNTDLVRELYRDRWHVAAINALRSISADGTKRKPAKELLISSYPIQRGASEAQHGKWFTETLALPLGGLS